MSRIVGGRYELGRKIAEGGMGAVYEARHTLSRRTVALKILFADVGRDEAARQRFLREVSAPATIGHDGITEVYDADFDPQDGSMFVAMEMLEGETLGSRLARGAAIPDVLALFERLLEPLAAAHAKGIIHRDLKPENAFLHRTRDGREILKLLDFGIARVDADGPVVTQAGVAMGTPHYMAPEQAISARDVGPAADVWSVGAMMYEALGGRTPFEGETPSAVVVHAMTTPHAPLRSVAPAVPPAVAELIDRCLAKEPAARFRNGGELLAALRAVRANLSSVPRTERMLGGEQGSFGSAYGSQGVMPMSFQGSNQTPGPFGGPPQGSFGQGPYGGGGPPFGGGGPPTQSGSGCGKPLIIVLVLIGVLGMGLLVAGGVAFFLFTRNSTASAPANSGNGTLHVQTALQGELFVDGTTHGPVNNQGHDLSVPVGLHQVEIRNQGAAIAATSAYVQPNTVTSIVLDANTPGTPTNLGTTPIPPGAVLGSLEAGDQTLSSGELSDRYPYTFTAGQHVHIEAISDAFDTYLILRAPSGQQFDNDDGEGTGRNAMLDQNVTESGQYTITVTSYRPGEHGSYALVVR